MTGSTGDLITPELSGDVIDDAIEGLDELPAVEPARARFLRGVDGDDVREVLLAAESEPSLALRLLRIANGRKGSERTVASISAAIADLDQGTLRAAGESTPSFGVLRTPDIWQDAPESVRVHAVAVRRVAERIADLTAEIDHDEFATAALLHDVGKLALWLASPTPDNPAFERGRRPDERVKVERRQLGVDHAAVGAHVLRRWRLPESIVVATERHHDPTATGLAAGVRLADLIAHHAAGQLMDRDELVDAADVAGVSGDGVATLLYDLPDRRASSRRTVEPSPLSDREHEVLRLLSAGAVYKEIAHELDLAPSTVRSHLHRIYKRLDAADRTQAVLVARERGWI